MDEYYTLVTTDGSLDRGFITLAESPEGAAKTAGQYARVGDTIVVKHTPNASLKLGEWRVIARLYGPASAEVEQVCDERPVASKMPQAVIDLQAAVAEVLRLHRENSALKARVNHLECTLARERLKRE